MRKAISVGVGKLIISLLSIYIWKVYSDNLSLAEIGVITLLLNFDAFFGLVSASPFGNYLSLTALKDFRNRMIYQKVSGYFAFTFVLSLVSLLIFCLYSYYLELNIAFPLALLFIIYVYLNNAIPIIPTLLAVLNRTELSVFLQIVKSLLGVLSLIIVFFYYKSVAAWIIASVVGVIVPGVINIIFLREAISSSGASPLSFKRFIEKEAFIKFIIPYAALQFLMWYFFGSYRIYTGKLFDLEFLGKVGLAFTFASQFCSAFDSVITQIYQADFYRIIDEQSNERKLEKFGCFLERVQPAYMLFLVLGFLPFVLAFQYFLKPQFTFDIILLLSAWVFNYARISMNLYGLITQVLLSPKIIMRYVLLGVVLSLVVFGALYYNSNLATENMFLLGVAIIPLLVMLLLVTKIAKWFSQFRLLYGFILTLFFCAGSVFLLQKVEWFVTGEKIGQLLTLALAGFFLIVIGLRLLTLQKRLKDI